MKATIILVIILLILLWKYNTKEGFASETKLNTFLNTWHLTNNEISNTMTATDNSLDIGKNITFPKEKGIIFGSQGNKTMDNVGHKGTIRMTNGNEMHIVGGGNPRRINLYDDVYIQGNIKGNLNVDNDMNINGAINIHGAKHIKVGDGTGGDENNWIRKNELCIGGTCINKEHLQILKGEKDVHLKNNGKNALIDCGGKSGDSSSTQGMRDGKTCYINNNDKTNGNQQFRLVM